MSDRWLRVPEAADYLGISESTIYHWSSEGRGPTPSKIGRLLRWKARDLDEWMRSQQDPIPDRNENHDG